MQIRMTNIFKKWIDSLVDSRAKYRILVRIQRLEEGNAGDCSPVGSGLSEMRIHYGTGYRVYFKTIGNEIIILLCGGDKSTQKKDIVRAKQIAKEI